MGIENRIQSLILLLLLLAVMYFKFISHIIHSEVKQYANECTQITKSGIFRVIKFSKSRAFLISTDINAENEGQNFLYARKESIPLTASIFPKLITVHWHYVEISCTEFHRNGLQNVERRSRKSLAPFFISMVLNEPIFMELTFSPKII